MCVNRKEWTAAENKRKTLQIDVARLKKSIEDAPLSREQFVSR